MGGGRLSAVTRSAGDSKAHRAWIVIYVCCLPILWPTLFVAPILGKVVVLADLAFLLLVLGLLLHQPRLGRLRPGLIAVAALPVVATSFSAAACGAWSVAVPNLLRLTYSMSVLLLFAHLAISVSWLEAIWRSWLVTSCLVCGAGLVSYLGVQALGWPQNPLAHSADSNLGEVLRIGSVMSVNSLPVYLQTGLAAWAVLYAKPARRLRPVGRLMPALLWITALLTFSRGVVGLLLQTTVFAYFSAPWLPRLWRLRHALAALTGAAAACAVAATFWAVVPMPDRVAPNREALALGPGPRKNAYWVLHVGAIRMLASQPFTGVGPGRFPEELGRFTTAEERARASPPVRLELRNTAHSFWLSAGAETGAPGVIAWIVLFGVLLRLLWRGDAADASPALRPVALRPWADSS